MSITIRSAQTIRNGVTLRGDRDIARDGLIAYLDAGIIASYPGTGTAWYDLSGQSAHATLNGTVGFVNSGTSSYFTFDGISTNNISSSLTQEYLDCTLVFYPDFTYSSVDANLAYGIGADNDITLRFGNANSTGPWTIRNPGDGGDWVMVGTTATYYINNQAYPSPNNQPLIDGWNIVGAARTNVLNGYYTDNKFAYVWGTGYSSRGFKGKLAAILLYNRVLAAEEQQQNYQYFTTRKQY